MQEAILRNFRIRRRRRRRHLSTTWTTTQLRTSTCSRRSSVWRRNGGGRSESIAPREMPPRAIVLLRQRARRSAVSAGPHHEHHRAGQQPEQHEGREAGPEPLPGLQPSRFLSPPGRPRRASGGGARPSPSRPRRVPLHLTRRACRALRLDRFTEQPPKSLHGAGQLHHRVSLSLSL